MGDRHKSGFSEDPRSLARRQAKPPTEILGEFSRPLHLQHDDHLGGNTRHAGADEGLGRHNGDHGQPTDRSALLGDYHEIHHHVVP